MNGRKAAAASRVAADPLQARPTAICTPSRSPMRLVLAPDSFKGSLSAAEVCAAMAEGIRRVVPEAEIRAIPMADGGEGTTEAPPPSTPEHATSSWASAARPPMIWAPAWPKPWGCAFCGLMARPSPLPWPEARWGR